MAEFEVKVSDFWLTISVDGKELVIFSHGGDRVRATMPGLDDIQWAENGVPPSGERIDVHVLHRNRPKEGDLLPRIKVETVKNDQEIHIVAPDTPRAKRVRGRTHQPRVARIGEHDRDVVLNEILDSFIDMPNQTISEREEETNRMGKKFGLRPMQVAGVRAALTRGAYGEYDMLLRNRIRSRFGVKHTVA